MRGLLKLAYDLGAETAERDYKLSPKYEIGDPDKNPGMLTNDVNPKEQSPDAENPEINTLMGST